MLEQIEEMKKEVLQFKNKIDAERQLTENYQTLKEVIISIIINFISFIDFEHSSSVYTQ